MTLQNIFRSLLFSALLFSLVASSKLFAHHGFLLHYDPSDQVRLEGTLAQADLKNPHSEISVEVPNANGSPDLWSCETQARAVLSRKQITEERFQVGDQIVLEGSRSRKYPFSCQLSKAYLADGSVLELRSSAGIAAVGVNGEATKPENSSIFGSWIRNVFIGEPVDDENFLDYVTEAGRAANAQYDPFTQDPPLLCRPGSPPRAWVAPGQPTEIRQVDDKIIIQHEFMDFTRMVNMSGEPMPEGTPTSEMGYSVGRLIEGGLVVESDHFSQALLLTHVGDSGLMHSDQLTLTETYLFNEESGNLDYSWHAEDELFFSQPITGSFALEPTNLEIGSFDCEIQLKTEE